ncbi:hypothetical protein [Micromonospora sp. NPDC023956]|uniref:hypothetical protein n=1 Tax=Micromonospora sp. NPDC023956 TaxID=3155722 RepID=UPI0034084321
MWNAAPRDARWYAEVVIERPDGETDYVYGYADDAEEPDAADLLPEGCTLLEAHVAPTQYGRQCAAAERLIAGMSDAQLAEALPLYESGPGSGYALIAGLVREEITRRDRERVEIVL